MSQHPIKCGLTPAETASVADTLRQLADHLEAGGPAAYVSGALIVDYGREFVAESLSENAVQRSPGPGRITVHANLVLRDQVEAPPGGVAAQHDQTWRLPLRWDGKPMRVPKDGEWYRVRNEFYIAGSRKRKAHWIYEEA